MQLLVDGTLVHSASDLNAFSECLHLTALTRLVAERNPDAPTPSGPTEQARLLARKGDEHERRHLERLRATWGDRLVAFENRPLNTVAAWEKAERESVTAMAAGAEVIYQAAFFDGTFRGRTDFLRKVALPSRFGDWSYEVIDTKLALSAKPYFLIQLCNYSEHLARVQGVAPVRAAIVLGSGVERRFAVDDYAAYYRELKASYLASVAARADAYPFVVPHCDACVWYDRCARQRDEDDHLSIVANIRRDQIAKLEARGIATVAALATATDDARPNKLRAESFGVLRSQAAEQHRYRSARRANGSAAHSYTFREPPAPPPPKSARTNGARSAGAIGAADTSDATDVGETADTGHAGDADGNGGSKKYGFAHLTEPAPGDVFFDMEGDPMYRPGQPLEYLFGVYLPDENEYRPFWGRDFAEERIAFEAFVDSVVARRERSPDLHVYHYAPYEVTALKRLMGKYNSRGEIIDDLLRAGTFVDLYAVVRQSVFISQPSYSIKKVEALYGFTRNTVTKGGDDSIVMFESWLDDGNQATLDDIQKYNDDDCRSTFELREWLVGLRAERNAQLATPIPWRVAHEARRSDAEIADAKKRDEKDAAKRELLALEERLLAGVKAPNTLAELRDMPEASRGRWLLGNLVGYHQREQKPEWWEHFHRLDFAHELVDEDRKAIAELSLAGEIDGYKLSPRDQLLVYTFRYPEQEHALGPGDTPLDLATLKAAGPIVGIDLAARTVAIKLSGSSNRHTLTALIPGKPLDENKKKRAIEAIARTYEAGTLDADHPATNAMLLGRLPRLRGHAGGAHIQPEHPTAEALAATIAALDRSYLVVQGPPGSGKSTKGAHAIVDLLAAGKRVALAAQSHKALHGLLHKIEETAARRGVAVSGCHKSTSGKPETPYRSRLAASTIADAPSNHGYEGCMLVSATTFAWADETQRGAFDIVIIDEAGQISLADALVTSLVAKDVVLLGDPQQLPQVAQGTHPIGSDRSILEHLLDEHATIPPDRGVFLDTSYRMQPEIDHFISDAFYDGRLAADPLNANNRVRSSGICGAGLRFSPVPHEGNARRSSAEAARIADEIALLLRDGRVTLRDQPERAMTARDILVVAPYNQQRREIDEALRARGIADVAVGTVDKFQGQEAPVVFFSLATSSAELAPRGLEFLLSPHRLNVAISRAQALSVVVASPLLLASHATTIEAMGSLNLLCAYVEAAARATR